MFSMIDCVLQNTVQREGVHQMHCFRHLPQQLQEAGEAVQQLMSSDLLSLLRAGGAGGAALQDPLLAAIMQNQEIAASGYHSQHACLCVPAKKLTDIYYMKQSCTHKG